MYSVTIHNYTKGLTAIEFGAKEKVPKNFLVFIGGLGDGFLTVPYVPRLADAVSGQFGTDWVLVQALISSSYLGFGTGSLERDAAELGELVKYLRLRRGDRTSKVILMGHSTGCQDTMQYLTKYSKSESCDATSELDAAVLQAPVSDREGLQTLDDDGALEKFLSQARQLIQEGRPNELLPADVLKYTFGSPVTAYRFNSLVSERGDDDYFSSYLQDSDLKNTFGKIEKPLLVLYGEKDEFVPAHVRKQQLLDSWQNACLPSIWSKHSKILKGATHNVGEKSDSGAEEDLIQTVLDFIQDLY